MPEYYDDDDHDDRRDRRRDKDRRDRDRPKSSRRERPPVYEEEEIIEARRGPARDPRDRGDPRGGALIRRPRDDDSDSADEEIPRPFPPGGGYGRNDRGPPRRAKSHGGSRYDDYDAYDGRRGKERRRKTQSRISNDLSNIFKAVEKIIPPLICPALPVLVENQNVASRWEKRHWPPLELGLEQQPPAKVGMTEIVITIEIGVEDGVVGTVHTAQALDRALVTVDQEAWIKHS